MLEGTETVIDPSPSGTSVKTTASVDPPISQDTFDRIPVHVTFSHSDFDSWGQEFKKGMRARLLLGLWNEQGPFHPVEGGMPDKIVSAGRKAQAAYWYAMKSTSVSEVADAINIKKTTVSIYASQIRWEFPP